MLTRSFDQTYVRRHQFGEYENAYYQQYRLCEPHENAIRKQTAYVWVSKEDCRRYYPDVEWPYVTLQDAEQQEDPWGPEHAERKKA